MFRLDQSRIARLVNFNGGEKAGQPGGAIVDQAGGYRRP